MFRDVQGRSGKFRSIQGRLEALRDVHGFSGMFRGVQDVCNAQVCVLRSFSVLFKEVEVL